jgi:hypothetical protein
MAEDGGVHDDTWQGVPPPIVALELGKDEDEGIHEGDANERIARRGLFRPKPTAICRLTTTMTI